MDILYYAKDREPDWVSISANEIVEEVYGVAESKAQSLGIALQKDIKTDGIEFEADHKAIRSLLINLVENSLDACRVDKEKDSHNVRISTRDAGEFVEFEIIDNGIGMEQETREKAFSLFFSSKAGDGTGLGLFIANKIVQAHQGKIQLESELNKGTRIIVKLARRGPISKRASPNAS